MAMKKIILLICFTISHFLFAQTYNLQSFATGFTSPVDIAHAGDSRLFIVQQNGIIRIVQPNGTVNTTNFLDISSKVLNSGEQGLLGLAFHPQYTTNGRFYVYYNAIGTGNITIAKYTVSTTNPDVANVNSEEVLMNITKSFTNHNGGCLKFGPDGYLWIATGDGGSGGDPQNNAQNLSSHLGKLLRINVNGTTGYTIPSDNPFTGTATQLDEIWAYGLRNPWRFSFDTLTGNILIADVGQNTSEEINRVPATQAGVNYGWRCYEGDDPYNTAGCATATTMTFPVATYSLAGIYCSITGGYVYRGATYPSLAGLYFFADYCADQIGTMDANDAITWSSTFSNVAFTTFGVDSQNELYIASSQNGTIYKITAPNASVEEIHNQNKIKIYPNPASDKIFVEGINQENLNAEFITLEGRVILNKNVNSDNSIDISGLNSGIYFITIKSNQTKIYTQKIIVK